MISNCQIFIEFGKQILQIETIPYIKSTGIACVLTGGNIISNNPIRTPKS
jgi:hypothetical protein